MKLSELLGRADLKEKFVIQKFLCLYLKCSREELWIDMDKNISDEIIQKVLTSYKSYVEDKKPLEFILGHVDFFGREFFVDESTLIPRPETEYMITAVTEYCQSKPGKNGPLLDIGTGCGVLGISVILQNPNYFSDVLFTDYFENALAIAQRNFQSLIVNDVGGAKKYVQNVQFIHSSLLDFLFKPPYGADFLTKYSQIVLVANLPYIPEDVFNENVADNVKKREPKPAFVAGSDGLDFYKDMFDQLINLKLNNFVMFLEMMTRQVDILRQLYHETFVFEEVKTFHFNIRIVKAWMK